VIRQEIHDHTLLITIDRLDKRNAVNDVVATGIEAAVDRLEAEPSLVWMDSALAALRKLAMTADAREGPQAFLESVDRKWSGG
jgi:enoyl-CoA hydratase